MDYDVKRELVVDHHVFIKFETLEQFEIYEEYVTSFGFKIMRNRDILVDGLDCASYDGGKTISLYHSVNFKHDKSYTVYKFEDVFIRKNKKKRFDSEQELCEYAENERLFIITKTREEYDCLMMLYERCGYLWNSGHLPTSFDGYTENKTETCIHFGSCMKDRLMFDEIDMCKEYFSYAIFIEFEEFYGMLE